MFLNPANGITCKYYIWIRLYICDSNESIFDFVGKGIDNMSIIYYGTQFNCIIDLEIAFLKFDGWYCFLSYLSHKSFFY